MGGVSTAAQDDLARVNGGRGSDYGRRATPVPKWLVGIFKEQTGNPRLNRRCARSLAWFSMHFYGGA